MRTATPRKPKCANLHDVFINIRCGRLVSLARVSSLLSSRSLLRLLIWLASLARFHRDDEGEHVKTMSACQVGLWEWNSLPLECSVRAALDCHPWCDACLTSCGRMYAPEHPPQDGSVMLDLEVRRDTERRL
jgi:hypothetical protein